MFKMSDAFITLPGGLGTIEELTELYMLNQVKQLNKPFAIFNINKFYSQYLDFLNYVENEGFITNNNNSPIIDSNLSKLMNKLLKRLYSQ